MKRLLSLLPILLLASGCTLIRESESASKEKMLAAAGFQMIPAKTPQQQASLAAMTPYKIQLRNKGGVSYYVYANPKQSAIYMGGTAQYAAYKKMAEQQNIATDDLMIATEEQAESEDWWDDWGPAWSPVL